MAQGRATAVTLEEQMIEMMRKAVRDVLGSLLPSALPTNGNHEGLSADNAMAIHELKSHFTRLTTPWKTRQEAADWCRCSVSHIDNLVHSGRLIRHDGPLYHRDELDQCIKEGLFALKSDRGTMKNGEARQ